MKKNNNMSMVKPAKMDGSPTKRRIFNHFRDMLEITEERAKGITK